MSIATPGANLGWPFFEGFHCRPSGGDAGIDSRLAPAFMCHAHANLTVPVVAYDHRMGCAMVGGEVYRGTSIRSLDGVYLFGDYCSGRIWALDSHVDPGRGLIEIADLDRPLSSFGIDADGEIFVVTFGGPLVRLVQTRLGYADSVTHRARITTLGAPLDSDTSQILRDTAA